MSACPPLYTSPRLKGQAALSACFVRVLCRVWRWLIVSVHEGLAALAPPRASLDGAPLPSSVSPRGHRGPCSDSVDGELVCRERLQLILCAASEAGKKHEASRVAASAETRPYAVDVDAWYRRYGEAIFRRCMRLSRNEAQSMDLVQETFLRAHRFRKNYRGDAKPLSWLLTIADRCFFDTLRKKQPVDSLELRDFLHAEAEGLDIVFTRHDLVARLLSRTSADVRQIVVLRYFDELDNQQIAAHLNVNERTVRRKLERFLLQAAKFDK